MAWFPSVALKLQTLYFHAIPLKHRFDPAHPYTPLVHFPLQGNLEETVATVKVWPNKRANNLT